MNKLERIYRNALAKNKAAQAQRKFEETVQFVTAWSDVLCYCFVNNVDEPGEEEECRAFYSMVLKDIGYNEDFDLDSFF